VLDEVKESEASRVDLTISDDEGQGCSFRRSRRGERTKGTGNAAALTFHIVDLTDGPAFHHVDLTSAGSADDAPLGKRTMLDVSEGGRGCSSSSDGQSRGAGSSGGSCSTKRQRRRPLQPNSRAEECPICMDEVEKGEGVKLSQCGHTVCHGCLERQLKCYFDDGKTFEAFICAVPECRERIAHRELRAVLGENVFVRLDKRSLDKAVQSDSNLFPCRATPDCEGKFCWEDEEGMGAREGTCEVCHKPQCIVCGAAPHRTRTCAEAATDAAERVGMAGTHAADEAATRNFLTTSQSIRVCSKCHNTVEKKGGCDKMQCRCGFRFCFRCGAKDAVCVCTAASHGFWDNKKHQPDFSRLKRPKK